MTDGRLTPRQYVEMLEAVILPSVRAGSTPPPQPVYVALADAQLCSSPAVQQWLGDHQDVKTLPWPPDSPDLMPLESVWAKLTSDYKDKVPRKKDSRVAHARHVWEELREGDRCRTLVRSMPDRLRDVIIQRGSLSMKY